MKVGLSLIACSAIVLVSSLDARVASAADLTLNNQTLTLGGEHHYGVVSITNNSRIIVPPFTGGDRVNTGNLVIHANSITIDATSRITAKGAGYQGSLCVDGVGPASAPLSGGRGGCSVRDSGGGGGHFGAGGRGTKDISGTPTFPASYEEDCVGALNMSSDGCADVTDCRTNDGLPTVAGQGYFHSIWAREFGASGGDKGCRDGDGFVSGSYGPVFLTAGNGGGRIVLAATNGGTGTLVVRGVVRADGNRGCGHGNDSAGGGAGGSILLVGDSVTIGPQAIISAKGGRGGDEQPKCLACTGNGDCGGGQTCVGGRCSPCSCVPCSNDANCNAALGQTCKNLGGDFGNVCADASNQCNPFDSTDDEEECKGRQNSGTCDDCGGGGGGGIINVLSRTRSIDVGATFNVSGSVGGVCPVCTGEAGGGAGELQIDGAYVGEICDGFDNDFDGIPDNGFPMASCGQGLCATSISTCSSGAPSVCAPASGPDPSCKGSRGTARPRIALLLDTSASMLKNLPGTVTFGDGSLEHPGIDTNSDTIANDSRLFLAKDAVTQLISAYPEIDFALSRYHQDQGADRSCQIAKWLECQSICCTYDDPADQDAMSPTACALSLPRQGGGTIDLSVHESSPTVKRCINYAGSCGSPRRGADVLVGFESDVRQYLSWIDGGESNFNADATPGNYCGGLTGDCELRGTGPTPIAEALRALYDYVTPIKTIDPAETCRGYSVIFVSDGGEECGGNPAAAAAELLSKGIKTYVIGVSVDTAQGDTLNAIAAAGGTTTFIPVNNSNQLLPALVSIVSSSIRTELCNGVDDNCNGDIDEGYNIGAPCDNGQDGICYGTGVLRCDPMNDKATECLITMPGQMALPAELCNLLDDDCDGFVDENDPQGGGTCGITTGECTAGTWHCQGGQLVCIGASGARPEVCNGADDDCNGTADDCGGVIGGCNGGLCGSSVGACEPGTWLCMGAAGYVCDGATEGTPETCNQIDDDCNGAIDDNVPGTGVACNMLTDGTPLCRPGIVRCLAGQMVCQGGTAFHPPTCQCPQDECTVPGAGPSTDGCPPGSACIGCACRTPCLSAEFPCSGVQVCRDGFCVPPECGGRLCAAWEDCINDQCADRCDPATCTAGTVCFQGACVENNCYGLGCPSGQRCTAGECVADPCASVACPTSEFCRDGNCVPTCADVYCPTSERCIDGICIADDCGGLCVSGEVCLRDGTCGRDPCTTLSCGAGRICIDGACIDDPCRGITCPGDPALVVCNEGQCVSVTPVPPPSPRVEIVSGGGGGFACDVATRTPDESTTRGAWLMLGIVSLLLARARRRREDA